MQIVLMSFELLTFLCIEKLSNLPYIYDMPCLFLSGTLQNRLVSAVGWPSFLRIRNAGEHFFSPKLFTLDIINIQ